MYFRTQQTKAKEKNRLKYVIDSHKNVIIKARQTYQRIASLYKTKKYI